LNNNDKNKTGILGSGFGLYGYFPAIAGDGDSKIVLLEKYRQKFEGRSELAEFSGVISWAKDTDSLCDSVDTLVICLSPQGQLDTVKLALTHPNINRFVLEKPLAVDPEKSKQLLQELIRSGKYYRIGYNFQYTIWGKELLNALNSELSCHINIDWYFMAHHYAKSLQNWKRNTDTGGGAIRFYGIHLIALLGHMKKCDIVFSSSTGYSDNDTYQWSAELKINDIHSLTIDVNSAAPEVKFVVKIEGKSIDSVAKLNDPFDEYISLAGNQDRRVGVIKPVLDSLKYDDQQKYWNKVYIAANGLWERIEKVTVQKI